VRVHIFKRRVCVVVLIGGKPDNALSVEMQLQRSHLGDQHINSHVPLGALNEQRVGNVLLNNTLLVILQICHVVNDADLAASRQVSWLANPDLFLFISVPSVVLYELLVLVRKYIRSRNEVVNVSKHISHAFKHTSQVVLGAENARLRKVNQLLV